MRLSGEHPPHLGVQIYFTCVLCNFVSYCGHKKYCLETNYATRSQYRVPCTLLHVKYSLYLLFFKRKRLWPRHSCIMWQAAWIRRSSNPVGGMGMCKEIFKIWNQKQCKRSAGVTFPVTDNFLLFVLTWLNSIPLNANICARHSLHKHGNTRILSYLKKRTK
jgi:hypothetical protein